MRVHVAIFSILLFFCQTLSAQVTISGKVVEASSGQAVPFTRIEVKSSGQVHAAQSDGTFSFSIEGSLPVQLIFSSIGFKPVQIELFSVGQPLVVSMFAEVYNLGDAVVTATRSDRKLFEVPQRIEVIQADVIGESLALSADAFLYGVSGMSVSRAASIFGAGDISLRGMGNEAGRTLVLIDGIPINKHDGGSVNWNSINTDQIRQIEVVKGPGSTVHGANAMGGVVNLLTTIPDKKFQAHLVQRAGTLNTFQTLAGASGESCNFYWSANGMYRISDGYIANQANEVNSYSVPSFLDEYNMGIRTGYKISPNQTLDLTASYYAGKRGTGYNYKGYNLENDDKAAENGSFNQYISTNGNITYQGSFTHDVKFRLSAYAQRENYKNIRESLRNNRITRYDVLSVREDMGLLSSLSFSPFTGHSANTGIDIRHGAVDGADTYITSSDEVLNKGKMFMIGAYIQDEFSIKGIPLNFLAGLRFDHARFYGGSFMVENPTNETSFLQRFSGNLDNAGFSAFSPRFSMQYLRAGSFRVYAAYSKGYRAPVLDDMCRTGRISGGMKIANPELKPEYLDNFEIGADLLKLKHMTITSTLYRAFGKDYHAYISTGDSVVISNRMRPVMKKSNIGGVQITGVELKLEYKLRNMLIWSASLSHILTEITVYQRLNDAVEESLIGKELVFQPRDLFFTSIIWNNKIVNTSVFFTYKGAQWLNEVNTEKIDGYSFIDLQFSRKVFKGLSASMLVNNVLDDKYIDSRNLISPGRMLSFQIRYDF
ncbi:MAG TPA: TonB-dependent receptor [Bacteroidales bacterium]|nr:TonB-dependent receptor [Bacteroidales bacterium]